MATAKQTATAATEPETTETVNTPDAPTPEKLTELVAKVEQLSTLVNHLLNSREHMAYCESDHFVNDWV